MIGCCAVTGIGLRTIRPRGTIFLSTRFHHKAARYSWQKPKLGCVKLNFDGTSKGETMAASIGGVYRNHMGEFLFGYAEPIGRATSSMAELIAARRGLELALENDYLNIWVEGDAKIVVDLLSKGKLFRPKEVSDHAKEIGFLMSQMDGIIVSHIRREGNRVADKLANMGHGLDSIRIWREIPPHEILQYIGEDAEGKVIRKKR